MPKQKRTGEARVFNRRPKEAKTHILKPGSQYSLFCGRDRRLQVNLISSNAEDCTCKACLAGFTAYNTLQAQYEAETKTELLERAKNLDLNIPAATAKADIIEQLLKKAG